MEKNWYFCADIRKGMYGLQQAGQIANYLLTKKSHHMATTSVGTYPACGGKNVDQLIFIW